MPRDLKIRQATRYDDFDFPEYQFEEWPQAIPVNDAGEVQKTPYRDNGKAWEIVRVGSQEELDTLLGGSSKLIPLNPTAAETSPMRVETEDDRRAALKERADQVGAKIDMRWSPERMEAAIAAHVEGKSEVV